MSASPSQLGASSLYFVFVPSQLRHDLDTGVLPNIHYNSLLKVRRKQRSKDGKHSEAARARSVLRAVESCADPRMPELAMPLGFPGELLRSMKIRCSTNREMSGLRLPSYCMILLTLISILAEVEYPWCPWLNLAGACPVAPLRCRSLRKTGTL